MEISKANAAEQEASAMMKIHTKILDSLAIQMSFLNNSMARNYPIIIWLT